MGEGERVDEDVKREKISDSTQQEQKFQQHHCEECAGKRCYLRKATKHDVAILSIEHEFFLPRSRRLPLPVPPQGGIERDIFLCFSQTLDALSSQLFHEDWERISSMTGIRIREFSKYSLITFAR